MVVALSVIGCLLIAFGVFALTRRSVAAGIALIAVALLAVTGSASSALV